MDNVDEILLAVLIGIGVAHYLLNTFSIQRAIEVFKECLVLLNNKAVEKQMNLVKYKTDLYFQIFNAHLRGSDDASALESGRELLVYLRETGQREMEGTLNFNLAELFERQSKYQEAKDFYEEALNIMKETGDNQGEETCYGCLGSLFETQGDYAKAEEYLQKGLAIAEEISDRDGEAACLGMLANVCQSLGKFLKAEKHLQQAIKIAREIVDREGEACYFGHLGSVYASLGEYGKAEDCHNKSLTIAIQMGDRDRESSCYRNLGTLFQSVRKFDEAEKYLQRALAIKKNLGEKKEVAALYADLGVLSMSLCEYLKAKEYFLNALFIKKETGDRKGEGMVYGNFASVFQSLGEYAKAEEYLQNALQIMEEMCDKNGEASCYGNLATVFHSIGEYAKAEDYSQKALAICKDMGNEKGEATNYGNLGAVFQSLGEFAKAIKYHEKALALRKKIGDKKGEADDYGNLGTLFYSTGDYAKAQGYYELALSIRKEISDKGGEATDQGNLGNVFRDLGEYSKACEYHNKALSICKEIRDIRGQCEWHFYLALDILAKGDTQEAFSNLYASIHENENLLGFLGNSDQFKIAFLEEHALSYQLLSKLFCDAGKTSDALHVVELGRARALRDLMSAQYSVEKEIPVSPQTRVGIEKAMERESSVCLYLSYFGQFLFLWVLKAYKPIVFRKIDVNDCLLDKAMERSVDEVLTSKTLIRKFKVSDQQTCEDRSWLPASNVSRWTSESCPEEDPTDKIKDLEVSLELYYRMLVTPVVKFLNEPEILIVPDRSLYEIPFAALKDENGEYLSERFRIRIVPSLMTLKLIQDSPAEYHSQSGALIVGDPDVGPVLYKGAVCNPIRLPSAAEEAHLIGLLLGAEPLLGQQATKQAVVQRINSVGLVHFAAHGNAERGEIVLAPPRSTTGTPQEEDYLLTMTDISQIRLRAKLVVLSCCHSARGKIKAEGVVGIARAFLGSGARSVLVTLWAIDDEETLQFMSRFYEHLVRGESASESLHKAMKWMRENDFSNVQQWAPFTLIGDDVTLDFEQ